MNFPILGFNVRFQVGRTYEAADLRTKLLELAPHYKGVFIRIQDKDPFVSALPYLQDILRFETPAETFLQKERIEDQFVISTGPKGQILCPDGKEIPFETEYWIKTEIQLLRERLAHNEPATPEQLSRLNAILAGEPV